MVKNSPASAGDISLIPGLGRFHMHKATKAHVPQLLSPCSRALRPQLLSLQPKNRTHSPALQADSLLTEPPGKPCLRRQVAAYQAD